MRPRILLALLLAAVAYLSFTATSVAATTAIAAADVSADGSLLDLAKPVLDAVKNGNGWLAAALAVVLLVTAARKFKGSRLPWLDSKAGAAAANVLTGFAGMLATAFGAGTLPSWALVAVSLKVSIVAAGGFTLIKELAGPALRWVEGKSPAWLRPLVKPVFDLILWPFEKRDPVADAKAAGDAAVKAKPAQGAAAVVDVEDLR